MLDGIRKRYPLAKDEGDGVRLVLGIDGTRVGLRARPLHDALVLTAFIDARTAVDDTTALALNAHLMMGALTLDGGDLLLRAVVRLDESTLPAEDHLERLAHEAARLKRSLRRVPCDQDVFDAYRE
jgi:hypothetical protein